MKLFKGVIFEKFRLSDYYWRIGFQHRGSPHSHGMYWLTNSPKVDANNSDSIEEVIKFIDRFTASLTLIVNGKSIGKKFVDSIFPTLQCVRRKFCVL